METHIVNKAIREILDEMVQKRPHYRWESICTSADGAGKTVIELNVYSMGGSEHIGRIAYQLETGDVLSFNYRGMSGISPESILDLVLDISNHENNRNQA